MQMVFGGDAGCYLEHIQIAKTQYRKQRLLACAEKFGTMLGELAKGAPQTSALLFQHAAKELVPVQIASSGEVLCHFRPIELLDQSEADHDACMWVIDYHVGVAGTFVQHVIRRRHGVRTVFWFLVSIVRGTPRSSMQKMLDSSWSHLWSDAPR
jgi:hypothetical protein